MKGKYIFCVAGLSALLISGCGRGQSQMSYLGIEEAKRLALEDAGLSEEEVEFTETDLSSRNGTDYYEVDFTAAGDQYEYDIDALTGVIIDCNVPVTDPSVAADSEIAGSGDGTGRGDNSSSEDTGSSGNAASNQDTNVKMLTSEEAQAKALAHAGLTNDQVTFVKSGLEYDDGVQVYDVEFYAGDNKEYDYEIDAYTGEVLSFDYDAESYAPSAGGTMITADAAKELALAQVPGAEARHIFEFEVDYDDGRTEYEGKIIYNGMEYEFSIDAYSGTFQSWEAEPVDD